jgi:hypothetical protein
MHCPATRKHREGMTTQSCTGAEIHENTQYHITYILRTLEHSSGCVAV